MIDNDRPNNSIAALLDRLPPGSQLQSVAFADAPPRHEPVLLQFPPPIARWAILAARGSAGGAETSSQAIPELSLLTVPASNLDDLELLERGRAWVDDRTASDSQNENDSTLMLTLQGSRIFWNGERMAAFAHADRLDAVRQALVEAYYYEMELRAVERALGENWPQLEADMPLAFEFDEQSLGKRRALREKFLQILRIRAQLARLAPHVRAPHLHPPTLASQIGERLRERTRMVHRHEFLGEQVEVFERVYELCGQRSSDYMLTRSSNVLEWVIIVLLAVQILLWGFELLANFESPEAETEATVSYLSPDERLRTNLADMLRMS